MTPAHTATLPDATASETAPAGWARWRRYAVPAMGLVILALLLSHAHKVDWRAAWQALQAYPAAVLLTAFGFTVCSHVLYGCFDLLGRHHTRHRLAAWRTWSIAVCSYAFNLNLGSLVGGVAMRARLYARAGLDEVSVAQVVGVSLTTNWLGYGLLAGGLFAAGLIEPPGEAHMTRTAMRVFGAVLLALAALYVVICAAAKGREWKVRGRTLRFPSPWLALLQLSLSTTNWALMGFAMYTLLGHQVPYPTVLSVLMVASIVGVVMPIPGGLGVLEAVYLALLSDSVGQGALMGAVMAYRALYYLIPLASGLVLYVALERYASAHPTGTSARGPEPAAA